MKLKSVLALCLVALFCVYLFKKRPDVAEVLQHPNVSTLTGKKQVKNDKNKILKTKRRRIKRAKKLTVPKVKILDQSSLYKSDEASRKILKTFEDKTFLKLPNFNGFSFADFSEDEVGILVGKNAEGDKLTVVATRQVPNKKDILNLLKSDPTFLQASDPDFRADLMRPVMSTGARNGFSDINVWKSKQNGKDYYMFFAPRSDGKGSYGILLDGEKASLDKNEDYYEKKLLEIRARAE